MGLQSHLDFSLHVSEDPFLPLISSAPNWGQKEIWNREPLSRGIWFLAVLSSSPPCHMRLIHQQNGRLSSPSPLIGNHFINALRNTPVFPTLPYLWASSPIHKGSTLADLWNGRGRPVGPSLCPKPERWSSHFQPLWIDMMVYATLLIQIVCQIQVLFCCLMQMSPLVFFFFK